MSDDTEALAAAASLRSLLLAHDEQWAAQPHSITAHEARASLATKLLRRDAALVRQAEARGAEPRGLVVKSPGIELVGQPDGTVEVWHRAEAQSVAREKALRELADEWANVGSEEASAVYSNEETQAWYAGVGYAETRLRALLAADGGEDGE
jgi:hypothetical protein